MGTIAIPFGPSASIIGKIIDPHVNRFTGIPFALPPVGDNRWKHPRKLPTDFFQKLGKPYDATGFKDLCLQPPSPLPQASDEHPNVPSLFASFLLINSIRKIVCTSMSGHPLLNHHPEDGR
jgi:Carboxylesterase family